MGSMATERTGKPYPPGIHVPSLTWFAGTKEQEIDWPLQKKHLEFLVKSGLHGGEFASPPSNRCGALDDMLI